MTVGSTVRRAVPGSVVAAFLRRDWEVAWSYRLPFLLEVVAAAFTLLAYFFVSRLVSPDAVAGGYFTFVTVGLALAAFLQASVSTLAGNVRQEQVQGTLEATLSVGLPVPMLAAGMAAYPLASAAARAVVYVVVAALLGAQVEQANWGLAIAATVLGSVSFAGLGLMAAALVLAVRQALAATGWLVAVLALAGGVLFPPRLLPGWALRLSELSPFTLSLRLARRATLEGAPWAESWPSLLALTGLAAAFAAAGIAAVAVSLVRQRRRGGSAQY